MINQGGEKQDFLHHYAGVFLGLGCYYSKAYRQLEKVAILHSDREINLIPNKSFRY